MQTGRLTISMVCDFVFPNYGGVETHIMNISLQLKELGHRIIIITHEYPGYLGKIFYKGITIYYLKSAFLFRNTTLYTTFLHGPSFKKIYISENINLVHGHQSSSPLSLEGIFHAQCLGIRTVFTEHSMFPILPPLNLFLNTIIAQIIKRTDVKITVSQACRKNLSGRLNIPPNEICLMRNSVDFNKFYPNFENQKENPSIINLIVITRFEERKGVCILVKLIDLIFKKKNKYVLKIVGQGSLESFIEKHIKIQGMEDKIQLLGPLDHSKIPFVLNSSDIFINTSLTESFCISILEAAACGLKIVSTDVGGVREVLPRNMIYLTDIDAHSIYKGIKHVSGNINRFKARENHEILRKFDWRYVTLKLQKHYLRTFPPFNACSILDYIFLLMQIINIFMLKHF